MFDEATRLICMTNIVNIIKATGGKNLILSSHVDNFVNHRSPFDISSLLISLGLNKTQALSTMKQNS
jgi:RNase P/RNase MRP subunit p30